MTPPEKIWLVDPENAQEFGKRIASRHGTFSPEILTRPRIEYTRTATIPDPMSDPRVVALVDAAKAIGRWNVKNLPKTAAYDELCALDDALSALTKEPPHER